MRNAKLRVEKMKAEVGKMEAEVRVQEAEVRVRDERVGKMEAEVRVRDERVGKMEARLELAKAALASSNTELLRYKRKCGLWMCGWAADRPTVSPLASPRSLRLPVHVYIPTFPLQTS